MRLHFFLLAFIFPGYFFFHVAYSKGVVPYVPWLTAALCISSAALIAKDITRSISKRRISTSAERSAILIYALLALFVCSSIAVSLLRHFLDDAEYISRDGMAWTAVAFINICTMFYLGTKLNTATGPAWMIALAVVAAMLVFSILLHLPDYGTVNLAVNASPLSSKDQIATYQGLAMSLMIFTILTLPYANSKLARIILLSCCFVGIYYIGARTELVLTAICIVIFIAANFRFRNVCFTLIVMAITTALLLTFWGAPADAPARYNISGGDASISERATLFFKGIDGIYGSPFLGDYLGQVRDFGSKGAYIHNALSVWQQYGVVSFLAYMGLCLASLVVAFQNIGTIKSNRNVQALFMLSALSLVAVVFAKPFLWPVPALAWGLACSRAVRKPHLVRQASIPIS